MKKASEFNFEDKVVWVRGLIVECPMNDAKPDCPLEQYRALSLHERMNIVKHMSTEEIDKVIAHHKECIKQREA